MSHLGSRILFTACSTIRRASGANASARHGSTWRLKCARPVCRCNGLESGDPLSDFDIIAFTLQYELSFSNILNMLDLGGIPVLAKDRTELKHIVACGGP